MKNLNFEAPDRERFPSAEFRLIKAGKAGGTAPAVLNAANEQAVSLFLDDKITFWRASSIWSKVRALNAHAVEPVDALETVLEADAWARRFVAEKASRAKSVALCGRGPRENAKRETGVKGQTLLLKLTRKLQWPSAACPALTPVLPCGLRSAPLPQGERGEQDLV